MKRLHALVLMITILCGSAVQAQTMDQKAWNAVWDRYEQLLNVNLEEGEVLQILNYPVPVAWGDDRDAGSWQLQAIAGIIPKASFALDPSANDRRLHDVYRAIVADAVLPEMTKEQQVAFDKAKTDFNAAAIAYETTRDAYLQSYDREIARLERRGEPVGSSVHLRIRNGLSNMLVAPRAALVDSATRLQNLSLPNDLYRDVALALRMAATGASSDPATHGLWTYDGNQAVIQAAKADCAVDGDGWVRLRFDQSVTSQTIRSSGWNANGRWSGSFFSLGAGGGGSSYENMFSSDGEFVGLSFCNLTYLSVGRGPWFSMTMLEAIDRGDIVLKEGSAMRGQSILGPTGQIPLLVKGLVIARSVRFEAKLSTARIEEIKRQSQGSGGFRVGPFRIGGGGASSTYKKTEVNTAGNYVLSTAFSQPVVLAVVIEPTRSVRPNPEEVAVR